MLHFKRKSRTRYMYVDQREYSLILRLLSAGAGMIVSSLTLSGFYVFGDVTMGVDGLIYALVIGLFVLGVWVIVQYCSEALRLWELRRIIGGLTGALSTRLGAEPTGFALKGFDRPGYGSVQAMVRPNDRGWEVTYFKMGDDLPIEPVLWFTVSQYGLYDLGRQNLVEDTPLNRAYLLSITKVLTGDGSLGS